MSRRVHRTPHGLLFGLLVAASGCSCDSKRSERAAAPAVSSAPAVCVPLAQRPSSWRQVAGPFFSLRLPEGWLPAPAPGGAEYRHTQLRRKIALSVVELPVDRDAPVSHALDTLIEGVRSQTHGLASDMKLGLTHEQGTDERPIRYFMVSAKDQSFLAGLVGQRMANGVVRAVHVTYSDEGPGATSSCTEQAGLQLMQTIRVLDGDAAHASPPVIRFTPTAVAALQGELQQGEVVWVAVKRSADGFEHVLEVRSDLAPKGPVLRLEGIPVVIDPDSEVFVQGSTVDHVEGQGFRFNNPNVRP